MSAINLLLLFTCTFVWVSFIEPKLFPVIEYYEIKGNEMYVNASIAAIGNHHKNVSYLMQFEAYRPVNDLKTYMTFYIRAMDGAIQNPLVSRWFDGCAFIRRPSSDRLVKLFYDAVKKYSKIPRCPYKRGDTMVLNITPAIITFPNIFPETDFMIEARTFIKAGVLLVFETHWYGSLLKEENVKELWTLRKKNK